MAHSREPGISTSIDIAFASPTLTSCVAQNPFWHLVVEVAASENESVSIVDYLCGLSASRLGPTMLCLPPQNNHSTSLAHQKTKSGP